MSHQTTKQDVADLLENFKDYVNPDGVRDPWFTLAEINQQFAWEDIPEDTLRQWLEELTVEGKVVMGEPGVEWRWEWGSDG
jgi:predicted transcriptional regulator